VARNLTRDRRLFDDEEAHITAALRDQIIEREKRGHTEAAATCVEGVSPDRDTGQRPSKAFSPSIQHLQLDEDPRGATARRTTAD
jgi:hypothetical protein